MATIRGPGASGGGEVPPAGATVLVRYGHRRRPRRRAGRAAALAGALAVLVATSTWPVGDWLAAALSRSTAAPTGPATLAAGMAKGSSGSGVPTAQPTIAPTPHPTGLLLAGHSALILQGSGRWLRYDTLERMRFDAPGRGAPPAIGEAAAGEAARHLLAGEYLEVEVLATRYVLARHLGPEEPSSSEASGVSAPEEIVYASRAAWAVLLRGRGEPASTAPGANPPEAARPGGAPRREVEELLVLDGQFGTLLARLPPRPAPAAATSAAVGAAGGP